MPRSRSRLLPVRRGTGTWPRSLLAGLALVAIAYPQVLLLGGSFAPSGYRPILDARSSVATVSVYPDHDGREMRRSNADLGAALWQLEPATKLMARSMRTGEDPRWNPYAATGSLGPETMGDLKYAPLTLVIAVLGATAAAYTAGIVLMLVLSATFMVQTCARALGLGWPAAVGAGALHLVNGFAVANVNAQIAAPYYLAPVLLYSLLRYRERRDRVHLAGAVAAHVALLLTTLIPVVLLVGIVAHLVTLLAPADPHAEGAVPLRPRDVLQVHALPAVLSLGIAGFLVLPLAASLRWTSDMDQYAARSLRAYPLRQILSTITTRHFWDAYNPDTMPALVREGGRWVGHIGAVPLLLAAAGWPRARRAALCCLVLAVLAVAGVVHHLGVPGLSVLSEVPGLHVVRNEYWIGLTALTMPILIAYAIHTIAHRPRLLLLAGAVVALAALFAAYGLRAQEPVTPAAVRSLVVLGALAVGVGALLVGRRGALVGANATTWALVVLIVAEGLHGMTHERPVRLDRDDPPPGHVAFLRAELGGQRVLNVGRRALQPDWGAALAIRQADTMNLAQSPFYRRFWTENVAEPGFFLELGHDPQTARSLNGAALDLLSVRFLVVDGILERFLAELPDTYTEALHDEDAGIVVLENTTVLPRAHLVSSIAELPDAAGGYRQPWSSGRALTDDTTFLEDIATKAPELLDAPEGEVPGSAMLVTDDSTEVVVAVEAERQSVLVLTDSFHPGWRAEIDGREVPIGRVNGAFRGIVVPEGSSEAVFSYHQPLGTEGLVLTGVSLLLLAALLVRPWRTRAHSVAGRRDVSDA